MKPAPAVIVDLGCGNGRDSHYFASMGLAVIGIDRSAVGVAAARSLALRSTGAADVHFLKADLTTAVPWRAVAAALDGVQSDRCVYYGRFLLHTMTPGRRLTVLSHLARTMQSGDLAVFEFRTPLDAELPKQCPHRRWYVDHADLARGLAGLGLNLDVDETGTGLAIFGEEDPHVARVTLTLAR
jgi:SAM-dependent methyltransferase